MSILIVIAAYNAEDYIRATMSSVMAQSIQEWRLVVVDDGSNDHTGAIVQQCAGRDQRIHLIRQRNQGASAARNAGAVELGGEHEYIMFLDSDDLLKPDALRNLRAALESDVDAVAADGSARYINESGEHIEDAFLDFWVLPRRSVRGSKVVSDTDSPITGFNMLIVQNCIPSPGCVLLRSNIYHRCGGFDESLVGIEDWDLWVRAARFGYLVHIPDVVLLYRRHSHQIGGNRSLMAENVRLARQKMLTADDNSSEHLAALRVARLYWYYQGVEIRLRWVRQCLREGDMRLAVKLMKDASHDYISYVRASLGLPVPLP